MTIDEVRKITDDMASKITEFILEALDDEDDQKHRLLELATSFATCCIDVDDSIEEIGAQLSEICKDILGMGMVGLIRYKTGNKKNVVKEWRDTNED